MACSKGDGRREAAGRTFAGNGAAGLGLGDAAPGEGLPGGQAAQVQAHEVRAARAVVAAAHDVQRIAQQRRRMACRQLTSHHTDLRDLSGMQLSTSPQPLDVHCEIEYPRITQWPPEIKDFMQLRTTDLRRALLLWHAILEEMEYRQHMTGKSTVTEGGKIAARRDVA